MSVMKVSIIIPCFNAVDKIGRCLASLRNIDMPLQDYEVIFIDDCSTDGTYSLIKKECKKELNWFTDQLPINSGSPSRPRNHGFTLAKGEYIFYLDCDDEILPESLRLHYEYASSTKSDVVRGSLLVDDGRKKIIMNRLENWSEKFTNKEKIAHIVQNQSMGSTNFIHRSLLENKTILWQEDIRMGEDTLFLARILVASSKVGYIDQPAIKYNKFPSHLASTTQSFGARELADHLVMWPNLANILLDVGINYYKTRFKVSLRYILSLLIQRNRGDIDKKLFNKFSQLISNTWEVINNFGYSDRYEEILLSLHRGDYDEFCRKCRPRLLIAGYDLKFIVSAVPELQTYYEIRIDEWPGHNEHDESKSRELLDWAELIWCEWLLGNAVWYSEHKKPHQKLIIRMHRFELSRDYGENLRIENVDAITAVSVHFFERLLERYSNIPRAKVRLLPNFINIDDYEQAEFCEQRLFTLAIIGILPARKRFDKALRILAKLREKDSRYRLEVFGKKPEELHWIATNKKEMSYFEDCRKFIKEKNLGIAIKFHGHTDIKKTFAQNNVGFVLSTSESMLELPGFESFHLAVADAFAGGGIGLVLHWNGAEYIWPEEFIFPTEEDIVNRILFFQNRSKEFQEASQRGRKFIGKNYDIREFSEKVKNLYLEML